MTSPGPDWYRDPGNAAQLRWWNGNEWTGHTRADEPPVAAPVVPPEETFPLRRRERADQPAKPTKPARATPARSSNPFAWIGLAIAGLSFAFDPLAIPSALAIVVSAMGLWRALVPGKGRTSSGLALAIAGLVLGIVRTVYVLGLLLTG